jgi:hypothetical protein
MLYGTVRAAGTQFREPASGDTKEGNGSVSSVYNVPVWEVIMMVIFVVVGNHYFFIPFDTAQEIYS